MVTQFARQLGQMPNPFHSQPDAETPEQVAARKRQQLSQGAQQVNGIASNQALGRLVSPGGYQAPAIDTPPQEVKGLGAPPIKGVTGTTTGPGVAGSPPPPLPPMLPPEAPPLPAYKTNQYAAPQHVVSGNPHAPAGYDPAKWADPTHQTPKYAVTRILSQFPDTPEGLVQALPEIAKAYPGATLVGKDKVNIPGVGIIDVGKGFAAGGGQGWHWIDTAEPAAGAAPGAFPTTPSAIAMHNVFQPLGGLQTNQTDVQTLIAQILAQLGVGGGGGG